jgi:hypothetical protein
MPIHCFECDSETIAFTAPTTRSQFKLGYTVTREKREFRSRTQ